MQIEIKKIPGKFDELNPDFRVTLGGVTMNLSYEELKELKILSNKVLFELNNVNKNTASYTPDEQNRKKLVEVWTTSNNRMQTIKEVRSLSGFGLLRARYFLENTNDQDEFIKTGNFILLP